VQSAGGDVREPDAVPPSARAVPFQELTDDAGTQAANESRTLIKSARGYKEFFGHAPPAGVDFSKQWVIFYSAGTRSTGGFDANILSLIVSGQDLVAVTELVSPGPECAVTAALTSPYVLIQFAAQPGTAIDFRKKDRVQHCGCTPPPSPCATVLCQTGTHCEEQAVECVAAPCPPVAVCVPDAPKVTCGGFAGLACPGAGKCVDDPSDGCDPSAGAVDCSGVCQCVETVACIAGTVFDSSPTVCACVPTTPPTCGPVCDIYCQYGNVVDEKGCPTCRCNPAPDPCSTVLCAAGTHCEKQEVVCVTAPCPPIAVCVPDVPKCGPVCAIACPYGNVLDATGCPTCSCNPPPANTCPPEKCPLPSPLAPTIVCADGTVGGPTCVQKADGTCGWTIVSCPTPTPAK
jgi:hypothetical protein